MAIIFLLLPLSFILIFIMTQKCVISLRKKERPRIEIKILLFSFEIDTKKIRKPKEKENKSNKRRIIFKAALQLLKNCHVTLYNLKIPCTEKSSITNIIRLRIFIASLLCYIDSIAKKLVICDNAIILSPDISYLQYDLSITVRLYQLAYGLIKTGLYKLKEKINVRE